MKTNSVTQFLERHFRHFNAAVALDAARAYRTHCSENGKMLVAMGGAMSTAEIGVSLAEMIRQDKVHAISCTGANLEEDLYNLISNHSLKRIPYYKDLSTSDEERLYKQGICRVTDACLTRETMTVVEKLLFEEWVRASKNSQSLYPHEYMYRVIRSGKLEKSRKIPTAESWLIAACEKNIPIFVPGWEDSSLGNAFTAYCIQEKVKLNAVKTGIQYMVDLHDWYKNTSENHRVGFFQIGGGIAGDFPICVVPMCNMDLNLKVPSWSYFCQISDSITSYGSYSGAPPNEKITWGKLESGTPRFLIESDATIVAPLVFAYVLEM